MALGFVLFVAQAQAPAPQKGQSRDEKVMKMNIQPQIEEMSGYLAVRFTGTGAAEEICQQFESIAEHCKRANKNKLLLDLTDARVEMSLADRYFLAEGARIFACYGLKVAGVARPEQLDPKRFGEMAARNRGVNILVFTNVKDAEQWLLE
jgi:hypothetical protein